MVVPSDLVVAQPEQLAIADNRRADHRIGRAEPPALLRLGQRQPHPVFVPQFRH